MPCHPNFQVDGASIARQLGQLFPNPCPQQKDLTVKGSTWAYKNTKHNLIFFYWEKKNSTGKLLQEPLHRWHDHVDPRHNTERLKCQRTESPQCLTFIVFLNMIQSWKSSSFLKAGAIMLFLKISAGPEFHTSSYSKINMQPQPQARAVAVISVMLCHAVCQRLL